MIRDLKWSSAEKLVAREAFEHALRQELKEIMTETRKMAANIEEASDLWNLERWLTQRRLAIDRKYDYRYSMLPIVFATLLREGRVRENDLHGLDQVKFELIGRAASTGRE